jgi:Protein kinase domain
VVRDTLQPTRISNDDHKLAPTRIVHSDADATRIASEEEKKLAPTLIANDAAQHVPHRVGNDDDESATVLSGKSPSVVSNRHVAVAIGTVLRDRYELEEILGTGSMGIVYRARDHLSEEMRDAHPFVAIKVINERFKQHPKALMSLQREARRAQTLAHENIITVHNFDRDGDLVFMTMELLDGQSLRSIIWQRAGLRSDTAIPMIRGMAKALAYAHENGIVHCDLKPSNVFFTARNQIKVLDFGVARALPLQSDAASERVADVGEVSGMTPAYASPQILAGEDPTPSDDVFSLGVVAYEIMTGRHPFDGRLADETALRHLRWHDLPSLHRSQRRALMRALASDRNERHPDAGEFLDDFEGPSRLKRIAYGSAAAALLLPVSTFLLLSQGPAPQVGVAFEDLPQSVQTEFNAAITEGQTALGFGAAGLNDAFQYFSRAYNLHPNNQRAVKGLETVADRLLIYIPGADAAAQRDAFRLLYCQDHLARYAPVAAACNRLLSAEQCAAIPASCTSTIRN